MKKLKIYSLFLLVANLLLCAVYCNAQSDTSKFIIGSSKNINGNNKAMTLEYNEPSNFKIITQKENELNETDTVKVVILISDTSNIPFIIKGYSVRKKYNANMKSRGDTYCWNCEDYMIHSYYLDDKKKPLSQNVTVWQSLAAK